MSPATTDHCLFQEPSELSAQKVELSFESTHRVLDDFLFFLNTMFFETGHNSLKHQLRQQFNTVQPAHSEIYSLHICAGTRAQTTIYVETSCLRAAPTFRCVCATDGRQREERCSILVPALQGI